MKHATRVPGMYLQIEEPTSTDQDLLARVQPVSDSPELGSEAYTGFSLLPLLQKSRNSAYLVFWWGVATSPLASVRDLLASSHFEDAKIDRNLVQTYYELMSPGDFSPKGYLEASAGGSASRQGVPSQSQPITETLSRLAKRFAQKASRVPAVKAVLAIHKESSLNIWTISDGKAGDRQFRQSIYGIEQQVLNEFPDARLDFRFINISEWPNPSSVQLPEGEVLYQRVG